MAFETRFYMPKQMAEKGGCAGGISTVGRFKPTLSTTIGFWNKPATLLRVSMHAYSKGR